MANSPVSAYSTRLILTDSPQIAIGCGAGFAGDRADAALPVIKALSTYDCPRYLIYEVLAERTLAIAQRLKREQADQGYSPWLDLYLHEALALCLDNDVRIVANFGSANPQAAAARIQSIASQQNCRVPKVAYVVGDDLLRSLSPEEVLAHDFIEGTQTGRGELLAANAYLGSKPIADALATDADIVVVGRSTDSALVLGPLLHEFGWSQDSPDLLATGIMAGHLIECGSQITGGYFADPGYKDVEGLDNTGFPILEMSSSGCITVTKPEDTGGVVNRQTVTEQLLYEIHDPATYLTPDIILDLTQVEINDQGANRVEVSGAVGRPPPATLKATICFDSGWLGEAEISYAGPNALARAELAASVIRKRVADSKIAGNNPLRVDILGKLAVLDDDSGSLRENRHDSNAETDREESGEYRVRAATRTLDKAAAEAVVNEVMALYCCGPAGGGGVRQSVTPQISTASILIDRDRVEQNVSVEVLS